jgi:hypothetical protein
MNTKLINHPQYYLLVDEEAKIKESDWYLDITPINHGIIYQSIGLSKSKGYETWIKSTTGVIKEPITQCSKIIAHLPKGNAPKLEGVDLLPEIPNSSDEDIFLRCFNQFINERLQTTSSIVSTASYEICKRNVLKIYKVVQSEKKYSEEDIKKAIEMAKERVFLPHNGNHTEPKYNTDDILQSLSTTTPIDFIVEEYIDAHDTTIDIWTKPKVINGVLQGKWKY